MVQAYIYARISADIAGDEHGVSSQLKQCHAYAEQRGWTIAGEYVDNDISAYSGVTRPQFEKLLQDMAAKRVPRLIVWHVDRLCRRVADLARVMDAAKAGGTEIHTVKAGDLDLGNASGELMAHMLGAFAQFESSHLSERQAASHADRASRGLWRGGRIPFGYDSAGPGALKINEEEARIIRDWTRSVFAGDTLMRITRRTKEKLGPEHKLSTMTATGLRQRLINPVLAGLIQQKGEIIGKGSWEPIITEDEHHSLVAVLNDPARRTTQGAERKWQGSGVYVCGKCGGTMHARKYKRSGDRMYYTCRQGECVTIGQAPVDEFITEVVTGYLDKPENRLHVTDRDEEHGKQASTLADERRLLITRKDALGTLFADGSIDAAQLTAGTREIQRRITEVESKLDRIRLDSPLVDLVLSGEDVRGRWEGIPADKRALIINMLMTITIMPAPGGKRVPAPERINIDWK